MDFTDSPDEAAYRAKARAWLEANAPAPLAAGATPAQFLTRAKAWQAKKAEAGFACITWPKDWGGGGGTPIENVIFGQEEAKVTVDSGVFSIGLGMCVPTVMAFADEATKQRFVGPAVRGDEIWCQLFSEPAGGSDVAAARTRAVRDGDDWVINGQKVWTSGAQRSDFGILLVRTDADVPKHKGLTMFWIDMKSPGIEVRPIHQMSGDSEFNEVYFSDVRVADSQRLGKLNDGWRVALVTLMNERLAVGGARGVKPNDILKYAGEIGGAEGPMLKDAGFRQKLADWYVQAEGLKNTRLRTMTALSRGQTPGPESSIGKIVTANQMQDMGNAALEMEEEYGILGGASITPLETAFRQSFMFSPGLRIAGGTDEILKNIIAERVLGLPGDIRVDKDAAFKDLPVGV
jgi:alkylation response protein AidB-like acyl-CoA dehydrogenase